MTNISRIGLLLAMGAALGGGVPYPEPSLYRAPETRRRSAPTPPPPVERAKTQRELDAEAKRARRRERNLRHAAKPAPAPGKKGSICDAPCAWRAPVSPAGDYLDDNYFESVDFKAVPVATLSPVKLTPGQKILLELFGVDADRGPVFEGRILYAFATTHQGRAIIAAAVKAGLITCQGVWGLGKWYSATSLGIASLEHARYKAQVRSSP